MYNEEELSRYDQKHIRVRDIYGETRAGLADYLVPAYCFHEYGVEEPGIRIGIDLLYASQIASIEEIEVHGMVELRVQQFILRRYRLEDADSLYQRFGTDPFMYRYSGWNPYATPEMARDTVQKFIEGYRDDHVYSWIIDADDVVLGTIGAYDYRNDSIEVGFSIVRPCWGRGYATDVLKTVLTYLTENEGISRVTAWCAAENAGSKRVLEKAGMQLFDVVKGGLIIDGKAYDKLIFEYRHLV